MSTSWKAKRTGKKKPSSTEVPVCCPGDFTVCSVGLEEELYRCERGHSGVLSILGITDLSVSIACKLFFWNFMFLENSVKQTMRSVKAPCEMTTPNRVL